MRGKISGIILFAAIAAAFVAQLPAHAENQDRDTFKERIAERFAGVRPGVWGTHLDSVTRRAGTEKRVLALTFDACDGRTGGYDGGLIAFLSENEISATLFVNSRWIDAHPEIFAELAANPLFEIANHGTRHKPLSVAGRSAYGIDGTRNPGEVFDEVEGNALKIENLTGIKPVFFRSGTAHYDDVSSQIVRAMGYLPVGFAINGDAGATLSAASVKKNLTSASGGEIVLMHMNRPGSGTLPGLKQAVPPLLERGFAFVTLSELCGLSGGEAP
jgi:peptidoglycan/xylan/chitin deacetylase (PgdA/CDA1 family)